MLDIHAAFNRDPPGLLGFLLTAPTPAPSTPRVIDAIRARLVETLGSSHRMPAQRRHTAASTMVHISNGLYAVELTAGATGRCAPRCAKRC